MMSGFDKLMLSIIVSLIMAVFFNVYDLFYSNVLNLSNATYYAVQLTLLSFPMFFFLFYPEDAVYAFFTGLVYFASKQIIGSMFGVTSFCLIDALIFSLNLAFIGFAIGFQKEQTFRNVKLSLFGVFIVLLAYMISIFGTMVYFSKFSGQMCYSISTNVLKSFYYAVSIF